MNKVVGVKFKGNDKIYHYLIRADVKLGQFVVVDSPFSGYTCVEVVSITWLELVIVAQITYKFIVCVVDDAEYLANIKPIKKTIWQKVKLYLNFNSGNE
jgi:hypothetical protein